MTTPRIIGIDIGGTSTRIATFTSPADAGFVPLATFPTEQDYDAQLARISRALHRLGEGRGAAGAGIGVSVGARLTRDGRAVAVAPNLPRYVGRPFAADLEARCGCPVRMAHDPVCGVLAERAFGALRQAERCAYLTLSTGTGAALALGKGEPPLALSIEIGHQLLDGNPLPCLCGQIGCLETYTGGRQLAQRYGRPVEELTEPAIWETFTAKLAVGLVNLAQLTRVEVVAVSGGIALNHPALLAETQRQVDARLRNMELRVIPAQLGAHAPLIGAAQLLVTPDECILH